LKNIYIITTSDLPNNVILSHAAFAKEAGFKPVFIFPDRGNKNKYDYAYDGYECIKLKTKFNVRNHFTYVYSILKLSISLTKLLLFEKKVETILAVDFECTLPCIFLKFKKIQLISLVNDNFSIRYNFNKNLIGFLRFFESIVYKFISNYCIFPDKIRVELLGKITPQNVIIIENILKAETLDIKYIGNNEDNLKVLFCGWLDNTRGLELLNDLLKLSNSKVIFYLVGSGDFVQNNPEILANERIKYFGYKTRLETLELMSRVDINMAYYNPQIIINRYALPQKISDSFLISCPCIINIEVETYKAMIKAGVALSTPYFDILKLSNVLNELLKDKKYLANISINMMNYSKNMISYNQLKTKAIVFYKSIYQLSNID